MKTAVATAFALVAVHISLSECHAQEPIKIGTVIKDCPDCPEMVAVPQVGQSKITAQHPTLYVARFELTWRQYMAIAVKDGCPTDFELIKAEHITQILAAPHDYPAVISPLVFECYLQGLNNRTGQNYRLPSRAEWLHANAAGTKTRYWWGDRLGFNNAVIDYYFDPEKAKNKILYYDKDRSAASFRAYPVDLLPPNPWGLYGTVGSYKEYLHEIYPADPSCVQRVLVVNKRAREWCKKIRAIGGDYNSVGNRGIARDDRVRDKEPELNALNYFEQARWSYGNPNWNNGFRLVR